MIGDVLHELLAFNGITQKQLAISLKIPYTTINGYVNNKREPDFKTVVDFANYFNVSTDYLLGHQMVDKMPYTPKDCEMLRMFNQLKPEQQEIILVQLKTMINQNSNYKNLVNNFIE